MNNTYDWVNAWKPAKIVAELKDETPFGWVNPKGFLEQMSICEEIADVISVHTDPLWYGSYELLKIITDQTTKPVLAKGFHPTIAHVDAAFKCGADFALTVDWEYKHPSTWHEVSNLDDLLNSTSLTIVWNQKNPRTGEPNNIDLSGVIATIKTKKHRGDGKKHYCLASNITRHTKVVTEFDMILVGRGLYE